MRISNIASRLRNRSVVSATILALVGAQAGLAQAATASGPSYGPDSRDLVTHTPIKHVIIIIGENWSFDSLFATYVPKSSDKVWNLLSENIVKPDGSPGMNYSKAPQSSATDTSKYELAPPSSPYLTLPPALAGGPFAPYGCQLLGINANDCNTPANVAEVTPFENGLAPGYYQHLLTGGNPYGHEPDPRIWYDGVGASSLPGGVYQLTNTTHSPSLPYDSYWSSPVHRLFQMLGGMGGAQPFAVTLNSGVFLGVDIDPFHIEKRIKSGYLDKFTHNYEKAVRMVREAKDKQEPLSIGLVGDIGTILQRLLKDGIIPDIATDQTSAHDPLNGYIPAGYSIESAQELRKSDPALYQKKSLSSMANHVRALLEMKQKGSIVFDYGNNLREFARQGGAEKAFDIPGFVPEYIRPLFCEGKGPFRWVALSGDPEDIRKTDAALIAAFPENSDLIKWLQAADKKVAFQGLPARICWLGFGEREKAGLIFNDMVRKGELKAPIVIGRDHLDAGSVASPNRETEGMLDGSDAVSDWPLLNLLGNCAGGATWVSFHHGGGVGMGFSQHAGMVIVADGTDRAERCLKRVLYNDPATGVIRHADAGYDQAIKFAEQHGLRL